MVPNTRLLGAILLEIVIAAAMVATIPVTTMQQTAKAYTYCSRTFLTQEERYKCGYNHGYLDAQRDWNSQRWTPSSGGDSSCPRAKGHTFEYCNGYQVGYRTSWNTWLYDYNNGLYPFQGVSDPIHCGIQGWPSCYSVGYSAGWYHAQGDWNTLQYALYSYGNSACPHGHSVVYCNGYHAGYIDLWNHWIYNQEHRINFVIHSQGSRQDQVCSSHDAVCMQSQQIIQQVKSHNMNLIVKKQQGR
jgi:hypothetical protein